MKGLFNEILTAYGIDGIGRKTIPELAAALKEFQAKTDLSIRKIAAITEMNKDRINRLLKS